MHSMVKENSEDRTKMRELSHAKSLSNGHGQCPSPSPTAIELRHERVTDFLIVIVLLISHGRSD